jgi:AcrR family transcriptional regulator
MLRGMGNREELLAGAKRCLIEKGYARTTARDIAAASGVSLAAIGYHFGSKDALMNQAVFDSVGDWAEELEHALTAEGAQDATPLKRFEIIMRQTFESFAGPGRGLWAAQLELIALAQRNEELREFLASVQGFAAAGLAQLFLGIDPERDPDAARDAGTVLHAFFIGMMAKWFLDPQQVPSAADVAAGMRILGELMTAAGPVPDTGRGG